jgi:dihydroorotase-like cyclic amidohydrolase
LPSGNEEYVMKADLVVKNGSIVTPEATLQGGVAVAGGKIVAIGANDTLPEGKQTIDATGLHVLPGLIDAHVHFRDPGVTHKEERGRPLQCVAASPRSSICPTNSRRPRMPSRST